MRCSLAVVTSALALGVMAAPRVARADGERAASLGWVRLPGAEACVGARDLAASVENRLGRTAFVPPASASLFIEGRVEPGPGGHGFHAHLAIADERGAALGVRDLDEASADCRALDEQLALVVALLIDPDAVLTPRGTIRQPSPLLPPPRVVIQKIYVPVPVSVAPPAKTRPPWQVAIEGGAAVAAGLAPGAAVGLSIRAEITPPSFIPIALGGTTWLDAKTQAGTKGASISLSYALAGVCPLGWSPGRARLRACADVALGAIRADGFGFRLSQGQEAFIAQGELEGRLGVRLAGPLTAELGLGFIVPFNRADFFYLDASSKRQDLYKVAAVAGIVDAALGVAFP
jgi:hypothetical protein